MPPTRPLFAALAVLGISLAGAPRAEAGDLPKDVALRDVLVSHRDATESRSQRTREEAKALADEVRAEAAKPGADFAALARAKSDDKAGAALSGLVSILEVGAGTDPVVAAALALEVGGVSPVVEDAWGFHVVKRLALSEAMAEIASTTAVLSGVRVPHGPGAGKGRTKEDAAALAGKAAAALRAGSSPRRVAADLGAEMMRPSGLPIVLRREVLVLQTGFEKAGEAVWALAPGGTADPVEVPNAYWVVQRLPWFRTRVAHLLVPWKGADHASRSVTRTKEEAAARAAEALAKAKADPAAWAQVVADYTEEPGGAEREGRAGLAVPGTFVPEFEAAIAALPPDGMSGVVETPFGFHVIRRTD